MTRGRVNRGERTPRCLELAHESDTTHTFEDRRTFHSRSTGRPATTALWAGVRSRSGSTEVRLCRGEVLMGTVQFEHAPEVRHRARQAAPSSLTASTGLPHWRASAHSHHRVRAEQLKADNRSSTCGCGGDSVPGPHRQPVGTIVRLKPHGAFRREATALRTSRPQRPRLVSPVQPGLLASGTPPAGPGRVQPSPATGGGCVAELGHLRATRPHLEFMTGASWNPVDDGTERRSSRRGGGG